MDKLTQLSTDFLNLARIALTGRPQDVQLLIHKTSKRFKVDLPELTEGLLTLLKEAPTRATPLRKHSELPLPVDLDSRLQLLKVETGVLDHDLILSDEIMNSLTQIVQERKNSGALLKHGLLPTKSILFNGPPGIGKTMAAKWIALQLGKPLLILDLTAVMSSFLGRTGNNIRFVLDYAKNTDCVLLLDELDAIAKRRDDSSEIGELKRLVTVLLQEIDDWPSTGLLISATNHPDLLDPAIWRRFEMVLDFKLPKQNEIETLVTTLLRNHESNFKTWAKIFSYAFAGKSFSDIERLITLARRHAAVNNTSLDEVFKDLINLPGTLTHPEKVQLACTLIEQKVVSQRQAHEITGVSRDTIRKNIKN